MKLEPLLNEFICECEYKQLATNTIKNYTRVLEHFRQNISIIEMEDLNKQIIKSYINNLTLATSSKNQYLRCIMSFLHWYEEEYDTSLGIHIKRLREQHKILYTPSDDEVKHLLSFYSNKTYIQCRNKTIVSVFINTGIRLNELLELKYDDIDLEHKIITVNRKGGYMETLPLNSSVLLQLTKYINRYSSNTNSELLFTSKNNRRLNPADIHYILKRAGNKNITPHSLRRYFATSLLITKGVPLIYVSRMLGHKDIQLTNKYYLDVQISDIKDYFK